MAAVKSKDTGPELAVRRLVHQMGYRYRLHRNDLPGKPDLAFPQLKKVIFVHGCFWHQHSCRAGRSTPKTNADFWIRKRNLNVERDQKNLISLAGLGWGTLVVWQCEIREPSVVQAKLRAFLGGGDHSPARSIS